MDLRTLDELEEIKRHLYFWAQIGTVSELPPISRVQEWEAVQSRGGFVICSVAGAAPVELECHARARGIPVSVGDGTLKT